MIIDRNFLNVSCADYLDYITRSIQNNSIDVLNDQQCLQYILPELHANHFNSNREVYNSFVKNDKKYLVLGSGCGYLERIFLENNNSKSVVGADWNVTDNYFQWWRDKYEVSDLVSYKTKDLFTDFSIKHKETDIELQEKFEAVLLVRFNGFWRINNNYDTVVRDYDESMTFLQNLKQYASFVGIHAAGMSRKMNANVLDYLEKNIVSDYSKNRYYTKLISLENL